MNDSARRTHENDCSRLSSSAARVVPPIVSGGQARTGGTMKTPWAVILCKFTDSNDEPFPKQYYKDLFTVENTGSQWNMIRYFSDYSHGTLDLTGTKVFGWYQLDKSVDDYNGL